MRLPSGYGQVIKLSGKRRRPYAVRVSGEIIEVSPGRFVRKEKYLEYFEKRADAMDFLAKYNAGVELTKTPAVSSLPTFAEVYEGFLKYYAEKHPDISSSSLRAYSSAYKNASRLHTMKFKSIRLDDLQGVISENSAKSKSTVANLIKLFHQMYKYAGMNDMIEKDYSQFVFNSGSVNDEGIHIPFSDEEISRIWNDPDPGPLLIMIFTGLRVTEFLRIRISDVDPEAQIMRGGIKTSAGKDRIIPIHDAILPFVREMVQRGGDYLYAKDLTSRKAFVSSYWEPAMKRLNMTHLPHDTRHTAASLMERYELPILHRKLILGHAVGDITEGVYTHVEPSVLVRDINKICAFNN